jgi:hypothetical protein
MRRDLEGRTARQLGGAGAPVAGEDEGGVGRGRGSRGCNGGGGRNDGCGEARLMSPMIATSCQPFPRKR